MAVPAQPQEYFLGTEFVWNHSEKDYIEVVDNQCCVRLFRRHKFPRRSLTDYSDVQRPLACESFAVECAGDRSHIEVTILVL